MSSFTEELTTTYMGKGKRRTAREFTYYVGEEDSEDAIVVPKGFVTDFASVPWPASMFIPKDGDYNQAAVTHDFLYFMNDIKMLRDRGVSDADIHKKFPFMEGYPMRQFNYRTRKQADDIFLEAMGVLGVNGFKKHVMHKAVRGFSWLIWGNKRRLKKFTQ